MCPICVTGKLKEKLFNKYNLLSNHINKNDNNLENEFKTWTEEEYEFLKKDVQIYYLILKK